MEHMTIEDLRHIKAALQTQIAHLESRALEGSVADYVLASQQAGETYTKVDRLLRARKAEAVAYVKSAEITRTALRAVGWEGEHDGE